MRSFSSFLTLETQSQRDFEAWDFGLISVVHDEAWDWGLITDPVTETDNFTGSIPIPTLTTAPGL